jgi:aminoglycoside phosphotransferase
MEARSIEQRALAAACAVAADHDVPCEQAAVPERWLGREVSVLSFLAPSGIAVAPSSLIVPGPYQWDGLWMTFWESVEHRRQIDLHDDAERLGRALREVHDELSAFSGELPGLVDLQRDIGRLLRLLRPTPVLSARRIESLEARLLALGETAFSSPLPAQALHGDASLSNLLHSTSGCLVWNDLEDTFRGPVHWDLAGYVASLEARGADPAFVARALDAYGRIDRRELAPFTAAHDVYDEIWRLYDAQRRS